MLDSAEIIEAAADAWNAGDWDALERDTRALGFVLDEAAARTLDGILDAGNGSPRAHMARRVRRMERKALLGAIHAARRAPHGLALEDGGRSSTALQMTTLALVVKVGARLTVGVTETSGLGASPGGAPAWREALRPWHRALAENVERCQAWARQRAPDRHTIRTAPLETEAASVAPPRPAHDEARALLAILAAPDDDAPRLVWADQRLERGDPRGELVMLQCNIAKLDGGAVSLASLGSAAVHDGDDSPERRRMVERERALLAVHERDWAAPLAKLVDDCRFVRGFVECVTMKTKTFLSRGEQLLAQAPVREVMLGGVSSLEASLAASPLVARLDAIGLGHHRERRTPRLGPDGTATFLASPHLGRLRALGLYLQEIGAAGAASIAGADLPRLERLEIFGNFIAEKGASSLARAPWWPRVRAIEVSHNHLLDEGFLALVDTARALSSLRAGSNELGPKSAEGLGRSPLRLALLDLWGNKLGDKGVAALAESPVLSSVRTLNLSDNGIGVRGAQALAASPHVASLVRLDLGNATLGPTGAQALLDSPHLSRLRSLVFPARSIPPALVRELRTRWPSV